MSHAVEKARRGFGRMKQPLRSGVACAAALTFVALAPSAAASTPTADSGPSASSALHGISWSTLNVAPGVQVRTGALRDSAAAPVWSVTVQAPAVNRLTGAATWAPSATACGRTRPPRACAAPGSNRGWSR